MIQLFIFIISVFAVLIFGLNLLIPVLGKGGEIEQTRQDINSIKANEEVFRTLLTQQPCYEVGKADSQILFGNPDAQLTVSILTNPFCNPCAKMHKRLMKLLHETNHKVGVHKSLKINLYYKINMKKLLFIFVSICIGTFKAVGENKVIFTLHDNSNSSYVLSFAEPLDGKYNHTVETFKQTITTNNDVEYTFKKEYPAIIAVEVAGRQFKLIMSPNTTVHVDIYPQNLTNNWIIFNGDNATGQKMYNDNYYDEWISSPSQILNEIEMDYRTKGVQIKDYVNSVIHTMDSLRALEKIADSFAEVIKKDFSVRTYESLMMYYNYHYFAKGNELTASDSIAIRNGWDEIFSALSPLSSDILAYTDGYGYLESYSYVEYRDIDLTTDKRFINVFDSYGRIGLFPDKFQKPLLGSLIINQCIYNISEFDIVKAIAYFREKYPDSEYLPFIDNWTKKHKQSQVYLKEKTQDAIISSTNKNEASSKNIINIVPPNSGIYIDTSAVATNINTLKELHETYFKTKKVFIDLWATWCKPCREEFAYKEQLDSLLKLHDIVPVYLSLDIPLFKKQWIQFIYNNKLTGYHFLINETLTRDIRLIANYSNPLSAMPIPHFIYMDGKGNIIEKDAPRPREISKLEELFSKNND